MFETTNQQYIDGSRLLFLALSWFVISEKPGFDPIHGNFMGIIS
jgi:hypothetical protein